MNIKTQMYRARHLVDVLSPSTLRSHGREFNFMEGNMDVGIDDQHSFTPDDRFEWPAPSFARQSTWAAREYRSVIGENATVQ